jgi:hypothetical protein
MQYNSLSSTRFTCSHLHMSCQDSLNSTCLYTGTPMTMQLVFSCQHFVSSKGFFQAWRWENGPLQKQCAHGNHNNVQHNSCHTSWPSNFPTNHINKQEEKCNGKNHMMTHTFSTEVPCSWYAMWRGEFLLAEKPITYFIVWNRFCFTAATPWLPTNCNDNRGPYKAVNCKWNVPLAIFYTMYKVNHYNNTNGLMNHWGLAWKRCSL